LGLRFIFSDNKTQPPSNSRRPAP